MKVRFLILLTLLAMYGHYSFSQGLAINATGASSTSSAILDVSSTNKGVLIPRMTSAERNAILTPATSLMVYQIDGSTGYYYFDGSIWIKIGTNTTNSCLNVIPSPSYNVLNGSGFTNTLSNTTAFVGEVNIPLQINANQISIYAGAILNNPGKFKIALYSNDGQTKMFEITTDTISTFGLKSFVITPSILINAGHYYIAFVNIGAVDVGLNLYSGINVYQPFLYPPGKNILSGYFSVPPDTLPATFDPTAISFADGRTLIFRLDN